MKGIHKAVLEYENDLKMERAQVTIITDIS